MNNIQMYGKLKKLNESEFVVVLTIEQQQMLILKMKTAFRKL